MTGARRDGALASTMAPGRRAATEGTLRKLVWASLTLLTACTYGPLEELTRVEQIEPLGDSFEALVVVRYDRYRRPTGLSTFPDGGKWRYEARAAHEYLIDAEDRSVRELAHQEAADSIWESFDAHIRGLEGDSVAYLALTGCPRRGECYPGIDKTELIRLSLDGTARHVSDMPASGKLPGTMLARRPGETSYVRYGRQDGMITARFEEDGAYEAIFRVAANGSLSPVSP